MSFWRDVAGTLIDPGNYWTHRALGDGSRDALRHTLLGPFGYAEHMAWPQYNDRCWGYTPYFAHHHHATPYCDYVRDMMMPRGCFGTLPHYHGGYNRWY